MISVPVLAVLTGGEGTILELEIEVCPEGRGHLFFDSRLLLDDTARTALKSAFSFLRLQKTDILVRLVGEKDFCLCSGSFALPVYLGMYAGLRGLEFRPGSYATGCINERGEVTPVADLAEKIRAVQGRAERLLVPKGQALPVTGIEIIEVADLQDAVEYVLIDTTKNIVRND